MAGNYGSFSEISIFGTYYDGNIRTGRIGQQLDSIHEEPDELAAAGLTYLRTYFKK